MPPWFVCRASVVRMPCLRGSYAVPPWFVCRASVARIPCLHRSYPVPRSLVSRALAMAVVRFRQGFLALLGKMPRLGSGGLAVELHQVAVDGSAHLAFRGLLKISQRGL